MATRQQIDYDALIQRDRVHGRLYSDPDVFEDELERIFHRGWVYVGHANEIPNPGDFRLAQIGRVPVIMVRDEQGTVQVLLNRCRHRAATVCQLTRGNTQRFRCAYHGWTYKCSGELAAVPYQDAYGGNLPRAELGLTKVPRVDSYRGFVFGSLSPAGITLEDHLGRARAQIDNFVELSPEGEIDVRAGITKYRFPANWKLQVENGMDGYHPNFTHQTFLDMLERDNDGQRLGLFDGDAASQTRDLGGGHVMLDYREYNRRRNLRVLATLSHEREYHEAMERRYGKERAAELLTLGGTHVLIFPNLIIIGIHMRVITPVRVDETEVSLYPTTLKGVPQEVNRTRLRGHEAFFGPGGFGQPDDLEMFARIQRGLNADFDPWLYIARGLHRERLDSDGTIVGQMTDEVTLRGIWAHYRKLMSPQGSGAATRRGARRSAQA
ncbi:MAG TPA: aromatic ring-hydroxylating dioxygenase subunit alpha [Candidatus Binataceae bacterium]|nr:aromatic ring-hydroxylating dioxygenase subunit alpha [Candidatus Binataceae bacterium]